MGVLIVIFTMLQHGKKSSDDRVKHPGAAWAYYANMVLALMIIVAGGMALMHHHMSSTPATSPASISPDFLA